MSARTLGNAPAAPAFKRRRLDDGGKEASPPPVARSLQHFFRGVMQSEVTCGTCAGRSAKLEDFHDVSLDLTRNTDPPTVHSTLQV